jgi:hypothetical protein
MADRDASKSQQDRSDDAGDLSRQNGELSNGGRRSEEKMREDEDMLRHSGEQSQLRQERRGGPAPYDVAPEGTPEDQIIRKGQPEQPGPTSHDDDRGERQS